jgi:hypothetical protein
MLKSTKLGTDPFCWLSFARRPSSFANGYGGTSRRSAGKREEIFWGSIPRALHGAIYLSLRWGYLRLRQRPMIGTTRQNSKILAPNGYNFFSNALAAKPKVHCVD